MSVSREGSLSPFLWSLADKMHHGGCWVTVFLSYEIICLVLLIRHNISWTYYAKLQLNFNIRNSNARKSNARKSNIRKSNAKKSKFKTLFLSATVAFPLPVTFAFFIACSSLTRPWEARKRAARLN